MRPTCDFEVIVGNAPPALQRCDDPADWVVFHMDNPTTALHVLVDGGDDMGMVPGLGRLCDHHRDWVQLYRPDTFHTTPIPNPACVACGYREEGISPSGYYSSRDQGHENLCCGAPTAGQCFWKGKPNEYCVTHQQQGEDFDDSSLDETLIKVLVGGTVWEKESK